MTVSWLLLMFTTPHHTPWALKPLPHSFALSLLRSIFLPLSFSLSILYPAIRKPYPLNLRRTLQRSTLSLSRIPSSISISSPSSVPFSDLSVFRIPTIPNSTAMGDGKVNLPDDLFLSKTSDSLRGDLIWFILILFNFRLGLFFPSLLKHTFSLSRNHCSISLSGSVESQSAICSACQLRARQTDLFMLVWLCNLFVFYFCFFSSMWFCQCFYFNYGLSWLYLGNWSMLVSIWFSEYILWCMYCCLLRSVVF